MTGSDSLSQPGLSPGCTGTLKYSWLGLASGATDGRRRKAYRRYIERMVCKNDAGFMAFAQASRYAIGNERFIDGVEGKLKELRAKRRETGDIAWPEDRQPDIAAVESAVMKQLDVSRDDLHYHGQRVGIKKPMAIEICCRLSGASPSTLLQPSFKKLRQAGRAGQREVSRHFGYKPESAIGKQRKLAVAAAESGYLDKILRKVSRRLA